MAVSQELSQSYHDINRLTRRFQFILDKVKLVQAQVFSLPSVPETETHLPVSEIDEIAVHPLVGESALAMSHHAFGHFYFEKGRSPKCPNKLPGFLQFQCDQDEQDKIRSVLKDLNASKDEFAQSVAGLPKHLRFPTVHDLFPFLVSKQLTRHIHLVEGELMTASFSLGRRNLTKKFTRDDMVKRLNDWLEKGIPNNYECSDSEIRQAISKIYDLPDDAYLVRTRDGKIQPVANLRFPEVFSQKQASLPLIYLSDSSVPVKVKPLQPYKRKERKERESRARSLQTKPILESIGLVARVSNHTNVNLAS